MPDLGKRDIRFLSTLSLRRATTQMQAAFKGPEISIHALLAESDDVVSDTDKLYYVFLSTLSLRRATQLLQGPSRDFYPRSPCGERRYWPCVHVVGRSISIHALLAESDAIVLIRAATQRIFLSTLSLRRATASNLSSGKSITISIHALLAESDKMDGTDDITDTLFLSTLSLRRATCSGFNF